MATTTKTSTNDAHATVRFSSDEWGVLSDSERGKVLKVSREPAFTGAEGARRLRQHARHKLKQGTRPRDFGPLLLVWPEASTGAEVRTP